MMANLGVVPDSELQKVLDIAAYVGDVGQDEVNVSYTSLLIGLMWSDDATSKWLQQQQKLLGVKTQAIYGRRLISEKLKDEVLANISSGRRWTPRKDFYSVSAKTVLQEAVSVAQETGRPPTAPLGNRHVAAVYLFRNPPGHNTQFHQEWGFQKEEWRQAFAKFIATEYEREARTWSHVLAGYVDNEAADAPISGEMLGGYQFDPESLEVLHAMESAVGAETPLVFNSEDLLTTLAGVRSVPDCAAFADLVAERLDVREPVNLPAVAGPFEATGSRYTATHGFKNILDRSRNLTRSITGTDKIGVRHIIAAIVVVPDSTANLRLVQLGVSLPLLRYKLLKDFTRRHYEDDGAQWRFHLVGPTPPIIAGFHSDSAERGDDRLDVTRYARAFAIVMAAQRVNPPVSIGIFGDWGSGKSFFMRLMIEQTKAISDAADTDAEGNRLFCAEVVPVRFNAWHYAEGNLWASLVQTILLSLRTHIVGDGEKESELMDRILQNLEVAKVARKKAEEALDAAKAEQGRRETELAAARGKAKEKAEAITKVKTSDVVTIVRKRLLPEAKVDNALVLAERYLKVEGAATVAKNAKRNIGDLQDLVNEGRVAAARATSSWDWVLRAPVSGWEIGALTGVAVIVLGVCAWLTATFPNAWSSFYSGMVEIGAILGLAMPWARRHLETVTKGLGQFESIQKDIDAKLAEERARVEGSLAEAERQSAEAAADVEQATARVNAAKERVLEAEREVEESRSVNRIARLLDERLNSKSYEQYLGIVAAIRADFEKLNKLMNTMRTETPGANASLHPIDRIVLYIDDLDRCPSKRVVQVLEAIHLLLAFELFVVVVGVDIRWAARSLAERYPRHLSAGVFESGSGKAPDEPAADALDYLEKIFQIPFWLPPMNEDTSRIMIDELVPRPVEKSKHDEAVQSDERQEPATERGKTERKAESQGDATSLPADTRPALLAIEPEERSFMLSLAGALGKSPRRLKRFVNTYRILKASLDGLQRGTFVMQSGREGEYRSAMVLLALVTAAPRSSLRLLDDLAGYKESDGLEAFEKSVQGMADLSEREYAIAALTAYRSASGGGLLTVKELQRWAPDVARFSFRSART
jgi:hypothetical protein